MKQIIILFVLAIVISCQCQESQVRLVWDQYETNADGVDYFVTYMWQGDDSTVFFNNQMYVVDTVVQVPAVSEFSVPVWVEDGKVIKGACVAYDSLGRGSDWAYTKFYLPPEIPERLRLEK